MANPTKSATQTEPLFREVQRFRQGWTKWALLAGTAVATGLPVVAHLFRQRAAPNAREVPSDDNASIIPTALKLAVPGAMAALMAAAKLEVEVRPETLHVRFWPLFVDRIIPLGDIEHAEAVTYRPLRDYGGWGVRRGAKGRAYNVSDDRGVRITFARREMPLLIGSQRAESLAAAIRQAQACRAR